MKHKHPATPKTNLLEFLTFALDDGSLLAFSKMVAPCSVWDAACGMGGKGNNLKCGREGKYPTASTHLSSQHCCVSFPNPYIIPIPFL